MTQLECGCRRNEELNACKSGFVITRKKHEQRSKQLSSAVQFVKAVANLDSGQQKGHTSSPSAYRRLEPLHTPPWLACLNPDRVSKGLALIDWKDCKSRWRWWLISGFRSIVKGMMQNFGDICIILKLCSCYIYSSRLVCTRKIISGLLNSCRAKASQIATGLLTLW